MSKSKLPIDPPIQLLEAVDQMETFQALLVTADETLCKIEMTPKLRAMIRLSLETVRSQMEVLQ